jgi:hypothetical protein
MVSAGITSLCVPVGSLLAIIKELYEQIQCDDVTFIKNKQKQSKFWKYNFRLIGS